VGCSLVLAMHASLVLPAIGSMALFGVELLGQPKPALVRTAAVALILFGSTIAATAAAQRARRSEALAARVGSDLENLARLHQRIIDNLDTGVLVVDSGNRARLLNDAARRQTGVRREDDLIALPVLFPALARTLNEWRINPHREPAPLLPRTGAPELLPRMMTLGSGADISTLVLLDETARLREQAQQMKLASLGRLSASIAHEIRNPLSAIRQAAQLLAEPETLAAQDRRLLDMIERHSQRIDRIVGDVLGLSRREEAMPAKIELAPWIARALDIYSEGAGKRRKRIDAASIPPGLFLRFDPDHLHQILFNLWDNSFTHGGADETAVRISLQGGRIGERGQPFLEISDNGRGIPEELVGQIFEPFFTTAHTGSGLGLYLARELCEYNQAHLEYVQRPTGAMFRLIFAGAPAPQNEA